jgi:hypothetical protein
MLREGKWLGTQTRKTINYHSTIYAHCSGEGRKGSTQPFTIYHLLFTDLTLNTQY